jgi:cytochrome bd-type quinol oxidase subunit 1
MIAQAIVLLFFVLTCAGSLFAQEPQIDIPAYRQFPVVGSRVAMWVVGQLHLMFAAFILGVPIFAVIIEFIGVRTRDQRYDRMAKEFIKLCLVAFSTTALLGALLLLMLIGLYPKFFNYMTGIFSWTYILYGLLFFGETFSLYLYWYTWDRLADRKWIHLSLGIALNLFGTAIMFVANAWLTFMTSPAGIDEKGSLVSVWDAVTNFTWMPINIHRLIANVAFGGAIVAAYAAVRFLSADSEEDRAHYDWMGYTGSFIAISALIPLPFAGYWLGKEIYEFNQTMGINMMGSLFSWLFIIQAAMIGVLFLGVNYYLWSGMSRISGAERYARYRPLMFAILIACIGVWATPRTLILSQAEKAAIGGEHHPLVGVFGVMSAKNTAVNLIILSTFLAFLFYRRSGKRPAAGWFRTGNVLVVGIFVAAVVGVIVLGVVGYYVPSLTRVNTLTPAQVLIVLAVLLSVTIIDILIYRRATATGEVQWGKMTSRSQYALILLAITFTSLMGLMGYARSGIREDWHVYGVMRDTSVDAYTPTLGDASNIIAAIVFIFFAMLVFVFWLGSIGENRKDVVSEESKSPPSSAEIDSP